MATTTGRNVQIHGYRYDHVPTIRRFAESDALVRGLMGPVGSGKSSGCCWELFRRAMGQAPGPDGVRRTRAAVIRNTDKELLDTTIKTFHEWFPPGVAGTWRKSERTFILRARDPSGRLVMQSEILFRAMDIPKQVRDLLSLELTFAWINEAREIEEEIFRGLLNKGRLGRYPRRADGGASWRGVWMDTNPPDDMSWWYRVLEEENLDDPDFVLFKQPSGRGPDAENIPNLVEGYYESAMKGASSQYVKVYIDGHYGTVEEGMPIYRGQWNDDLHVSDEELWPMKRQPILLGWDFGRTPAVVIGQLTPRGQLRILDEVCGVDMSIRQLINAGLKPLLATKYKGFEIEASLGDPSGAAHLDEVVPFHIVEEEGLPIEPAPSNDPMMRWEWVRHWLNQLRDGQPALLLNPTCRLLRRGFNGRYKFRRLQVVGAERRFAEKAEKNDVSHPHDALQYLCSHYVPANLLPKTPTVPPRGPADRVVGA